MRLLRLRAVRVGLTIVLLIGLMEVAVRWRARVRHGSTVPDEQTLFVPDPLLGRVLRPGARLEGAEACVAINRLGFRGREFEAEKPAGMFRIVFVGDSSIFGRYLPTNDDLLTARLQEILGQSMPGRIEVVNASVPGYTTHQVFNLVQSRVMSLQPDLIVVCQGVNDLRNQSIRSFAPPESGTQDDSLSLAARLAKAREEHFLSYQLIRKNITPKVTPITSGQNRRDRVPSDFASEYQAELDSLACLARDNGVELALCTLWRAFGPDQPRETQAEGAALMLLTDPYLSLDGLHAAFDSFNRALRQVAQDRGVRLLDLEAAIPADPALFSDGIHLNQRGHALAAGIFADQLRPLLAERLASTPRQSQPSKLPQAEIVIR